MVDRSLVVYRPSAYAASTAGAGYRVLAQLALGFGPNFPLLATGELHPRGLTARLC